MSDAKVAACLLRNSSDSSSENGRLTVGTPIILSDAMTSVSQEVGEKFMASLSSYADLSRDDCIKRGKDDAVEWTDSPNDQAQLQKLLVAAHKEFEVKLSVPSSSIHWRQVHHASSFHSAIIWSVTEDSPPFTRMEPQVRI